MAKLQKGFQDYFRVPVILKQLGYTSFQTLSLFADTLNKVQSFQIQPISQQNLSKLNTNNPQLLNQIKEQTKSRASAQRQKLLFLSEQLHTDWPQFQFIYKSKFTVAVYQPYPDKSLAEMLQKLNRTMKQQGSKLVGIIFLNDQKDQAKDLSKQIKHTIIPANIPSQQISAFIEPWLSDIVPIIEQRLISLLFEYRQQQSAVIIFNKNQEKSQPKIMKKKKKYRCIKLCGDIALMLHFYKLAYQTFNQAEQQLRKIDDYIWILGCIQGKIACMTSQVQIPVQAENLDQKIQQLIEQSYVFSKKIKQVNLQIQNNFKILKLFMDEPEKFQQMLQNIMSGIKLITQQQKFTYFMYIGSLYEKCGMIRKRNYYYYLSSLIYLNIKTDISLILLKKIKESQSLRQWETLHSKIIKLIIDQQGFFNKFGQLQLQLLQQCNSVLSKKDISITLDNLNFNNYEKTNLKQSDSIVQVRQFSIQESIIKPKLNRIGHLESPKRSTSTIFMGWKKNQNYLFQEDQLVIFKGSIFNKMVFPVHLCVQLQLSSQNDPKIFQLLLNPTSSLKFMKQFSFKYSQQPIQIKRLKLSIWNFNFFKQLKPTIKFQTFQRQPSIQLIVPQIVKIQQSQKFSLNCTLQYQGKVNCDKIRLTISVYYDIDVGFQQNQYQIQDISQHSLIKPNKQNLIKFIQSQQDKCSYKINQKNQLVFTLKRLKSQRKHVKKLQISIQYIQKMHSKYQIQKQYSIPTQIIKSIWGKITSYTTKNQTKENAKHYKYIDDFYISKVYFHKNNDNLAPYRISYTNEQNQKQQIILSDKTQQFMEILLRKIPWIQSKPAVNMQLQKKQINQLQQKQKQTRIKGLVFYWQNIVNQQINGKIVIQQEIHDVMFKPTYKIEINHQKKSNNQFKIAYEITTYKDQTLSHRLLLKNVQDDSNQFIIKGKLKIQNSSGQTNCENTVTLKWVQKQNKNALKLKKVNLIIQFANDWKFTQILNLQ